MTKFKKFSDHIDFSENGFLSIVNEEILSKVKKVSSKSRYEIALKKLQSSTKLNSVEEIISLLESRENTPLERKYLRIIKQFH